MSKNIYQDIEDFALYLKMPVLKSSYREAIQEANLKEVSYDQFLWELLQKECDRRQENAKQDRVRRAAFPYKKYLEDIIVEVAAARVTERGGRFDDKRSEAAMEDRKKEGYF